MADDVAAVGLFSGPLFPLVENMTPLGEVVPLKPLSAVALLEYEARHSSVLMDKHKRGRDALVAVADAASDADADGAGKPAAGQGNDTVDAEMDGSAAVGGDGAGAAASGGGAGDGATAKPAGPTPLQAASISLFRAKEEMRLALDLFGLTLGSEVKAPKLYQVRRASKDPRCVSLCVRRRWPLSCLALAGDSRRVSRCANDQADPAPACQHRPEGAVVAPGVGDADGWCVGIAHRCAFAAASHRQSWSSDWPRRATVVCPVSHSVLKCVL